MPEWCNKTKINDMGHFTIDLPQNRKGDVRWGKVTKVYIPFFALFRRKSLTRDEKTGYIIKVISAEEEKMEYRLYMSKEGNWFQDAAGTLPTCGIRSSACDQSSAPAGSIRGIALVKSTFVQGNA